MEHSAWSIALQVGIVFLAVGALWALCQRFMRPFQNRAFICLFTLIVSGWIVFGATQRYARGEGGFKLGVDLVGGTILIYEVDVEKLKQSQGADALDRLDQAKMVEFLKRRIDPNDLYNVTIRPVGGNTRYEIILPTGGSHQAALREEAWKSLLADVKDNPEWKGALAGVDLDIERDHDRDLVFRIRQALEKKAWANFLEKFRAKYADKLKEKPDIKLDAVPAGSLLDLITAVKELNLPADEVKKLYDEAFAGANDKAITKFIESHYAFAKGGQRKDFSAEMVEETKSLIARQGSLEFRIAANEEDDSRGIAAARAFIEDPKNKQELEMRARRGQPPPPVGKSDDDPRTYTWMELDWTERQSLGLSNKLAATTEIGKAAAQARADGKVFVHNMNIDDRKGNSGHATMVLFSREVLNERLPLDERANKKVEYFILLRDPTRDEQGLVKAITGEHLRNADVNDMDQSVEFRFDPQGGRLFGELTGDNVPTPRGQKINLTFRHLAIILDNMVVSAPYLSSRIEDQGQIQMTSSPRDDRVRLAKILRSGALPAPIKPLPVSESTIGPTLGGDTIFKGALSIAIAFAAVLVFMMIYYQFAGLVACVALLANLLLTVAFMVFVNATFTLPGMAALVLMLGMAVDANILIYERLREERERGAGLALALRNGYDRALPTILDTHLTSFFTAIVLYAVGNDQLRGFGIALAAGLVISLFTSLYMTRLIFDIWQYKGWLKQLNMFKLFSRTNIDFMRVRHYWFAATVALTIIGLAVFLYRDKAALNVDFVGGTAYGGQLRDGQGRTIGELRDLLKNQTDRLAVQKVEQKDDTGTMFVLTYAKHPERQPTIEFVEPVPGATKEEREKVVKERAEILPDWSVEQIFVSSANDPPGKSRFFTVRTTEKDADLVQISVDRLLSDEKGGQLDSLLKTIALESFTIDGKTAHLKFSDYASPGYLKLFLERQFKLGGLGEQAFDLRGEGKAHESRYKEMALEVTTPTFDPVRDREKLESILKRTQVDFSARPQPERLEKFDAQLAAETVGRAGYAIVASWAVILLFLWFRFGNWTFGLAAVLCLIHDLCFTLGAIAGCHYLVNYFPAVANALLIGDFKIDLTAIAALLTLIGFSVNDTIVVFDRIREVRGKNPLLTPQIINDGINQALSRTVLTSGVVFLVVGVLYVFGGESIRLFAFVMTAGVVVGTYSSIYVASPLLLMFGEGAEKKRSQPAMVPAATK